MARLLQFELGDGKKELVPHHGSWGNYVGLRVVLENGDTHLISMSDNVRFEISDGRLVIKRYSLQEETYYTLRVYNSWAYHEQFSAWQMTD